MLDCSFQAATLTLRYPFPGSLIGYMASSSRGEDKRRAKEELERHLSDLISVVCRRVVRCSNRAVGEKHLYLSGRPASTN